LYHADTHTIIPTLSYCHTLYPIATRLTTIPF
jgi:hypothetical protein